MTNLERLKGSGLLVQGFNEFLAEWFDGKPSTETPLQFHGQAKEIFPQLPNEVQQFYQVANRWLWGFREDCLQTKSENCLLKPYYADVIDRKRSTYWKKVDWLAEIIYHRHSQSTASISLNEPHAIYTLATDFGQEWHISQIPTDEFLIATALAELILCSPDSNQPELPDDALLLFEGYQFNPAKYRFYYRADGYLWTVIGDKTVSSCVQT